MQDSGGSDKPKPISDNLKRAMAAHGMGGGNRGGGKAISGQHGRD